MIFLIDYENTREDGFEGVEYLQSTDHVILFFSQAACNIRKGIMKKITATGCKLESIKLQKSGKNALDFYIATKVGWIFGRKLCKDKVFIISNDKGFTAVYDYWQNQPGYKSLLLLANNIQQAINSTNYNDERTKACLDQSQRISIEAYCSELETNNRMANKLNELFVGTKIQNSIPDIMKILQNESTHKQVYLNTLHKFGKKNGLEIYREIKKHKELQPAFVTETK